MPSLALFVTLSIAFAAVVMIIIVVVPPLPSAPIHFSMNSVVYQARNTHSSHSWLVVLVGLAFVWHSTAVHAYPKPTNSLTHMDDHQNTTFEFYVRQTLQHSPQDVVSGYCHICVICR